MSRGHIGSNLCEAGSKLYLAQISSYGKEVKVMLKIYIRYMRYALTVLATVGFGADVN